ncbi:unnamed protein product [Cuscuta campestris]|uniref:DUF4283 domain-containing protein n=1 Tax=Cuscuta campestris TaxID=132261 RepID=A0A484N4H5_9ASTE|nr:unnamed protein product [Cuscuta campestris]
MTIHCEEIPQSTSIQNASSSPKTTTIVSPDMEVLNLKVDEVIYASTSELGSSPQQSQLHLSTEVKSRGKGGSDDFSSDSLIETTPADRHMTIYEGGEQPKVFISNTYTELFPPLPRRKLSPLAPAFVPLSNNSFAALLNPDHEDIEEEETFSNINERSLVLYSNAVEDHEKERDGPILYTHSEGEDYVFIDSKFKPLQIDLSRCPKHPFHLRKAVKGRRTYSPSQMVTRSKAKLLEEGRRNTPIGWEEEDDLHDPQESHEDEVIKFFKLCCPNKIDEPKPPNKPLSKSRFPGIKAIEGLISSWHLECKIYPHEKGWVIFQFLSDEDRRKVLHNGPYVLYGKTLLLRILPEGFHFDFDAFMTVNVWVKYVDVPLKLWNAVAFECLGSRVGTPIRTDGGTKNKGRLSYCRMLIQVDMSKELPTSFVVSLSDGEEFTQKVVYEGLPNYCFHCKKFGHNQLSCRVLRALNHRKSENYFDKRDGNNLGKDDSVRKGVVTPGVPAIAKPRRRRRRSKRKAGSGLKALGSHATSTPTTLPSSNDEKMTARTVGNGAEPTAQPVTHEGDGEACPSTTIPKDSPDPSVPGTVGDDDQLVGTSSTPTHVEQAVQENSKVGASNTEKGNMPTGAAKKADETTIENPPKKAPWRIKMDKQREDWLDRLLSQTMDRVDRSDLGLPKLAPAELRELIAKNTPCLRDAYGAPVDGIEGMPRCIVCMSWISKVLTEKEEVTTLVLNSDEQIIIDGLLRRAPDVQDPKMDGPIHTELELKWMDEKEDDAARGDYHKEFEVLLPLFEKHISDDFEQSIWVIKDALRSPFIKEKIQKGLVKTLEGKALKATRDAMKRTQCIRAIKLKVSTNLSAHRLMGSVDGSIVPPPPTVRTADKDGNVSSVPNPEYEKWSVIDAQLCACLLAIITPSVQTTLLGHTTAQAIWNQLQLRYNSLSLTHIFQLKEQLHNIHKGTDSMQKYLDEIAKIVASLHRAKSEISDQDVILCILRGLPPDYGFIKQNICTNIGTVTLAQGLELDCHRVVFDDIQSLTQVSTRNSNILLLSMYIPTPNLELNSLEDFHLEQ